MSDERTPDPAIVARLRELGAEHEPDSDGIWARIDPARAGERERPGAPEAVRLDSRRDRHGRRSDGIRRPGLVAGLAAAGVIGVVISSQALGGRDGDGGPATAVPTVSVSGEAPTTPSVTPSTPSVLGSPTATRATPTGRTTSAVPTARPSRAGDDGEVSIAASADDVTLSTPRYLDWVVVGGRADGVTVRAKRPVGGAALTVGPPPSTTVAPGGGTVTWSGGVPEQSRAVTTWLASDSGAWQVTVAGAEGRRVLQVHAGLAPALRVEAAGAGGRRSAGSWTDLGTGRYVVQVEIPAGTGPVTVTLTPGDGRFAVSAVTLRAG